MNDTAIFGRCGFCDELGFYVTVAGRRSAGGAILATYAERGSGFALQGDGTYRRAKAGEWGARNHRCKRADVKAFDVRVPKRGRFGER